MPTSEETPLFRDDAVAHQQLDSFGQVIFSSSLSFRIMTAFCIFVVLAFALLGYFGRYTKKHTVVGQIVPDKGVMKLYTPQPGIVVESRSAEGRVVHRGDILFIISCEKISSQGETQALISSTVAASENLLNDQMQKQRQLGDQDRAGLLEKIVQYRKQISTFEEMIRIQTSRVEVAQDIYQRYENLFQQEFVSKADLQARKAELLDQQSRLASLIQQRTSVERELADARMELKDLPLRVSNSISDMQRQFHNSKVDFAESESKRRITIIAPVDGTATAVVAQVGQAVDNSEPLVTILPRSAKLQAMLYATSKAIGFVRVGDTVKLRYEAFPYEEYGSYSGTVAAVSRNALGHSELSGINDVLFQRSEAADKGAPYYRITVALGSDTVSAHGRSQRLQAGMLLEADIFQDTRRLYEWVLDPLYQLDLPKLDDKNR